MILPAPLLRRAAAVAAAALVPACAHHVAKNEGLPEKPLVGAGLKPAPTNGSEPDACDLRLRLMAQRFDQLPIRIPLTMTPTPPVTSVEICPHHMAEWPPLVLNWNLECYRSTAFLGPARRTN